MAADADEILDPPDEQKETPRAKKLTCEFCDCRLSQSGEVIHRSEKAKSFMDLEKSKTELEGKLSTMQAELEETKTKLLEATKPIARKKSFLG